MTDETNKNRFVIDCKTATYRMPVIGIGNRIKVALSALFFGEVFGKFTGKLEWSN